MILSLSEIMTKKNLTQRIEAPLELSKFKLDQVEYEVRANGNVMLEFQSSDDWRLSFTAKAKLSVIVPCSRCLEEVVIPFDIQVAKDLDFRKSENDRIEDLDELNYIDGYNMDVDVLIFDEILLRFPNQVLCRPDCLGLCKVCGKNLNIAPCECDTFVGDPRMSVIQDIFKNYKEV